MSKRIWKFIAGITLSAAISAALAPSAHAQAGATDPSYQTLPDRHGEALVEVKMVMKMPQMEEGREIEVPGTMIEEGGLVLVSNARIGGMATRMGMPAPSMTDVKVLIGDDTEGLDARVLARDSELDLAWIQIEDEKARDRKFKFVDLSGASTPKAGDRVYALTKMGKYFGKMNLVSEGRIAAVTRKPRTLYVPGGPIRADMGLPVFAEDGKAVGISVVQVPSAEESEDLPNGGFEGAMILPASEVLAATARGKEAAARGEGEPQPSEAPAPEPTTEEGTTGGGTPPDKPE